MICDVSIQAYKTAAGQIYSKDKRVYHMAFYEWNFFLSRWEIDNKIKTCKTACLILMENRIRLGGYIINMTHKATNQMLVLVLMDVVWEGKTDAQHKEMVGRKYWEKGSAFS